MKNFTNSDYALNKYSEGIVYRFTDRIVEVCLVDYLSENPDKTEQDFLKLKAISDNIWLEQDRDTYNQCRLNTSTHGLEDQTAFTLPSLEDIYLDKLDKECGIEAIRQLLSSNELTEIQRRRFVLLIFRGLTMREIAKQEGTSHVAVVYSIQYAKKKLRKYFLDTLTNHP